MRSCTRNVVRSALPGLALLVGLASLPSCSHGREADLQKIDARVQPWPDSVVDTFAHLPIMNGGRVKPVHTFADYTMLGVRGLRKMAWTHVAADGSTVEETILPVPFVLDALFHPEQARRYPAILVTDSDVLDAIGLQEVARKKRDRYSYVELAPGIDALQARRDAILSDPLKRNDAKNRTRLERLTLALYSEMAEMNGLLRAFEFARERYPVPDEPELRQLFGGAETVGFLELLERESALQGYIAATRAETDPERQNSRQRALAILYAPYERLERAAPYMLIPPTASKELEREWRTPGEIAAGVLFGGHRVAAEHREMLRHLVAMAAHAEDVERFEKELDGFAALSHRLAAQRGEDATIAGEVTYARRDYFYRSKLGYVFAFLFVAFSWLLPRKRWLWHAAFAVTVLSTIYLAWGVTHRSLLMGRPPVGNLYDTIPFITAICAGVALFIEAVTRRRLALPVGIVLGAAGLFLAGRYEVTAGDTMGKLVAVLNSNFWLATHVVTITIGYAAGLLAGAIGHVFVFGKLFKAWRGRPAVYKDLGRMIYGLFAFGLVFSVVGTILGGIWANDSWGRFWGWDPKENGALLICLYMIATLHARLGGYIRNFGMAISSVFGAGIVAFSWWGVNMLGVGLHSYGFTDGAMWVYAFYYTEFVVVILGLFALLRDRDEARQKLQIERARREGEARARAELAGS